MRPIPTHEVIDHHRVGGTADGLRGLRIANAEAHAHRNLHVLADVRQHLADGLGVQVASAGHALERHVVDVARGNARHLRHALGRARGSQQKDQLKPRGRCGRFQRPGFVRRHVRNDQTVDAGCDRLTAEPVRAKGVNAVVVGHENEGNIGLTPYSSDHRQNAAQRRPAPKRAFRRLLNDRAIRNRIGKRHTDFEDIGAR